MEKLRTVFVLVRIVLLAARTVYCLPYIISEEKTTDALLDRTYAASNAILNVQLYINCGEIKFDCQF